MIKIEKVEELFHEKPLEILNRQLNEQREKMHNDILVIDEYFKDNFEAEFMTVLMQSIADSYIQYTNSDILEFSMLMVPDELVIESSEEMRADVLHTYMKQITGTHMISMDTDLIKKGLKFVSYDVSITDEYSEHEIAFKLSCSINIFGGDIYDLINKHRIINGVISEEEIIINKEEKAIMRIDAIDNAILDCIQIVADKALTWDIELITNVRDSIVEICKNKNIAINIPEFNFEEESTDE